MKTEKKYGIRRPPRRDKSPYHYVRGTRRDGSRWEFATDILIDPPEGTPDDLIEKIRLQQEAQAEEVAEVVYRREAGELGAEECLCRLKGIAQRVTQQDSKVSTVYFILAWVWEHVMRGKVHPNRAGKISRVMYALLCRIGKVAIKTIHHLRPEHFEIFILERRIRSSSVAVMNDEVILLQSIAKDIKEKTGIDLAVGLELEEADTQERRPFTHDEVTRIFPAVHVMGVYAIQWRSFLMILLYTQMRPEDAAVVQRKDIDLKAGTIRFIAQKLAGFGRKFPPKPMHEELWLYLIHMLDELQLQPDDYLCPNIALKFGNNLNDGFIRILTEAGIKQNTNTGPNRKKAWSEVSLYSLRHTGITWMLAAGVSDEDQKVELGDSTTKSLIHYQHPNDPIVMAAEHRRVNKMPALGIKWSHNGAKSEQTKMQSIESGTKTMDTVIAPNESPAMAKRRRRINAMPGGVLK